jgi:hypothetical protein
MLGHTSLLPVLAEPRHCPLQRCQEMMLMAETTAMDRSDSTQGWPEASAIPTVSFAAKERRRRCYLVNPMHAGTLAALSIIVSPAAAMAHALPQRYELPVPLGFYLAAAGTVVVLSFFMAALVLGRTPGPSGRTTMTLRSTILTRLTGARPLRQVCAGLGVTVYLLVLVAGLFGNQHGLKNIAPVLVWVIWWVGFAFVAALLGNPWPALNPWRTLFRVAERWWPRADTAMPPLAAYPSWLGVWPAVVCLLIFAWMELVWTGAEQPRLLALAILLYSVVTWTGMAVYGRECWLNHGETFSIFFGVLGRFAPLSGGGTDPDSAGTLRPYALGLLATRPLSPSMLVFILLMLTIVTFDGFLETPLWIDLSRSVLMAPALQPLSATLSSLGADPYATLVSLALLVSPLVVFAIYGSTCGAIAIAVRPIPGQRLWTAGVLARLFVLTLVPIAVGYHVAHYLAYLLLAGQFIIPLASDPLGLGWDLFGTALYRFDIGLIDARTVWIVALTAVVLGHVAAAYLAHRTALSAFGDARAVRRSQAIMLVLMVGYTMSSLWILAQPIVVSPRLDLQTVGERAVVPCCRAADAMRSPTAL